MTSTHVDNNLTINGVTIFARSVTSFIIKGGSLARSKDPKSPQKLTVTYVKELNFPYSPRMKPITLGPITSLVCIPLTVSPGFIINDRSANSTSLITNATDDIMLGGYKLNSDTDSPYIIFGNVAGLDFATVVEFFAQDFTFSEPLLAYSPCSDDVAQDKIYLRTHEPHQGWPSQPDVFYLHHNITMNVTEVPSYLAFGRSF